MNIDSGMFKKRGQGQSWSLDIILATVVFLLIIGIFYSLLSQDRNNSKQDIQIEANMLLNNLDADTGINTQLGILHKGAIDPSKLSRLYSADYLSLKQQLGLRSDFCIYLVDQRGNLISIENNNSQSMVGYGNGNFSINDMPCGTIVN